MSRPGARRPALWLGLTAGLLAAGAWQVYRRRPVTRRAGHATLDDPAIGAAFARVAAWPQMRLLRRLVLRRTLSLATTGRAVDIGCGPGQLALELARRAPALHVSGLDLAPDLLAEGEANARTTGLSDRVDFRLGDAAGLPYEDGALDLVVSTLSLHHWEDPQAVFDEIARVLRPGGVYVIFDLRRDMPPLAYLLLWFATRVVVPRALRRADEPLNSRHAAYTPAEVAALAGRSRLPRPQVDTGPLWLFLTGRRPLASMPGASSVPGTSTTATTRNS